MKDVTKYLQGKDSLAAQPRNYEKAIDRDIKFERTPYLNPVSVNKGTLQTASGGLPDFLSANGGTSIFTIDPDTGIVTINGAVVVSASLNLGTINNTKIGGTSQIIGTLTNNSLLTGGTYSNAFLGTPQLTGGTVNPSSYQTNGTAGISGSVVYVKTTDYASSVSTFGTLSFRNGLITASV